jgi:two-component system, OmpR family, aerobic respiration control sensor histidine kinase ArcB
MLNEETKSIKKDGTETSFLTSKIPLLNEQGEVTALPGISYEMGLIKK